MRLTKKIKVITGVDNKGIEDVREVITISDKKLAEEKLFALEDIEDELGIDLIIYIKLVQEGFYGFCEDEDHDKPYIFNFLPRDFVAYSDELVVYWEDSDKVYKTYKYKDYGKTWALTKEELL